MPQWTQALSRSGSGMSCPENPPESLQVGMFGDCHAGSLDLSGKPAGIEDPVRVEFLFKPSHQVERPQVPSLQTSMARLTVQARSRTVTIASGNASLKRR